MLKYHLPYGPTMRTADDVTVEGVDLESVRAVLAEEPVSAAVLYGSVATGDATSASDVDIAVEFESDLSSPDRTRARLAIIEKLSRALGTDDIDVVPFARLPPEFRREVLADGILIYGSLRAAEPPGEPTGSAREDRLERFDDMLAKLEKVV